MIISKMSINLRFSNYALCLDNDIFGKGYDKINDDMIINSHTEIHSRLKSIIESGVPLGESFSCMFDTNYFYHPIYGLCTIIF